MAGNYLGIKLHQFAIKHVWIYLLLVAASDVSCLQCFNCGAPGSQYKRTCDSFNSNSNLDSFIEDCQVEHHSCSTIATNGVVQVRHCDEYKVNDCEELGDTKYCFCVSNLCNGVNFIETSKLPIDDEDMEGSGTNHVITEKPVIPFVHINNASTKLCGTIIILAVLLHF